MKCPLFLIGKDTTRPAFNPNTVVCLKEECAWWHEGLEECRLVVLTDDISTLMGTALNLFIDLEKSGKLPHWRPDKEKEVEL